LGLVLVLGLTAPASAQLGRISDAARGGSDDRGSSRDSDDSRSNDSSSRSSDSGSSDSGSSSGSSSRSTRGSTTRGGGSSVRVARAPVERRLVRATESRNERATPPTVRVEAPRATVRPVHVRATPVRTSVQVTPVSPRPVRPQRPIVTVTTPAPSTPAQPPPVRVQVDPPPVRVRARPVDPTVAVFLDAPEVFVDDAIVETSVDCVDPASAADPADREGSIEYSGGVGFAPPDATIVDAPSAGSSGALVEEAPVAVEEWRTRGHLALDLGPTRIHGVDGRIFRTSFDGRVQFERSVDLDLAYALLVDGQTALGLGRFGGAVRVIDGTHGFVRAGLSYVRLRDSEGVVHGGELVLGFGVEGGRISTLFDGSVGRLGESWTLAARWTVGVLLTRGLELILGVDHTSLIPSDESASPVRFTTPTLGLRVLL
jgi:hypothetical protein